MRFVQARLPLEREGDFEPVDLLISSKVLEYVDDLDHILAQFSRLVKPGSALVLSVPNLASRTLLAVAAAATALEAIWPHVRGNPILHSRYALLFFDIGNNKLAFFDLPGLGLQPVAESLGGVQHMPSFWRLGVALSPRLLVTEARSC